MYVWCSLQAPERFKRNMCKKSDIYSWGIMLYQVVTCVEPFRDVPSGESDQHTRSSLLLRSYPVAHPSCAESLTAGIVIAGVTSGKLRPKWPAGHLPELQEVYERCDRGGGCFYVLVTKHAYIFEIR